MSESREARKMVDTMTVAVIMKPLLHHCGQGPLLLGRLTKRDMQYRLARFRRPATLRYRGEGG